MSAARERSRGRVWFRFFVEVNKETDRGDIGGWWKQLIDRYDSHMPIFVKTCRAAIAGLVAWSAGAFIGERVSCAIDKECPAIAYGTFGGLFLAATAPLGSCETASKLVCRGVDAVDRLGRGSIRARGEWSMTRSERECTHDLQGARRGV